MTQWMHFQGPSFTLQAPTDWFITSTPQVQAMFIAQPEAGGLRPNVAVTIRPVEDTVTPRGVAESAREVQQHEYPRYTVLEELDGEETGQPLFLRRYSWFNQSIGVSVLQVQLYCIVSQLLYTVTATRSLEDEESSRYDDIFRQMIDSLQIQ